MAALVLENLSKLYENGAIGVRNLSIEVPEGELIVLVGPSGCGKSTTLRLIAGLERPTEGRILIGGKLANDVLPRDRDTAMVFQDYALYPHLNVQQNMGFGLKIRRLPRNEIHSRVIRASRMLGIEDLLMRRPKELSGGQRQRVALGRALVRNPKVFLLDEPLSNLDISLRTQLRREIKDIHKRIGATMVYVTHDQNEAMALGQRIGVMNAGTLEQIGSSEKVYRSPETKFVAGFFGSPAMNLAECIATGEPDGLKIRCGEKHMLLRSKGKRFEKTHLRMWLGFRAEDVCLGDVPEDDSLRGRVRVALVEAMGAETQVFLEDGDLKVTARVLGLSDIRPGSEVTYSVSCDKLHFFDRDTGKRIRID